MNKWLLYFFITAEAVFCLTADAVNAVDDLITFDRSRIEQVRETCDIRVIAKLDDRAVALTGGGGFEKILKVWLCSCDGRSHRVGSGR